MAVWWNGLTPLAQTLFSVAVFFSVIFIWQFASALSGIAGDGDVEMGEADDLFEGDMAEEADLIEDAQGLATFRLLSVRSILAFGLLFSWAAALYLAQGLPVGGAMLRAGLWGLAGMAVVAGFFWLLPRLTEEGTARASSAVGQVAEVYIGIPADGMGQVRVLIRDQVRFVKARSVDGGALPPGRRVQVESVANDGALVVQSID